MDNNNKTKVNSLTQFIGYYNSDDDENDSQNGEEDMSTDANEKIIKSTEWTTCYAKDSGHPYYWNTRTREVTWNIPDEYSNYLEHIRNNYNLDNIENNIKNWIECPSDDTSESYYVNKITRIVSWTKPTGWQSPAITVSVPPTTVNKTILKSKTAAAHSKSKFKGICEIDEKIELINYYAEKTDSSSDEDSTNRKIPPQIKIIPTVPVTESDFESIVPTKLSQKIYSLKNDLHPDSLKVSPLNQNVSNSEEIKSILLASSAMAEHDDKINTTKNDPLNRDPATSPSIAHDNTEIELFDAKLFKRKKRIEFLPKSKEVLVPASTTNINPNSNDGIELNLTNNDYDKCGDRTNEKDSTVSISSTSMYSNFSKGNVEFKGSETADATSNDKTSDKINIDLELKMNIKDLSEIMKDKLKFLSESTSPATSAQVMFIQFDTLMMAYESKNLNEIYLLKWLKETNATLEKLEKEAVPDDWKCEWDRSSSRYFYENLLTGKKQWDFPVEDVDPPSNEKIGIVVTASVVEKLHNGNDEMDISTTPPPPVECDINNIPLSEEVNGCNGAEDSVTPKTPPPPIISDNPNDALGSELESFYSDLATIEQVTSSNNNSNDGTNSCTTSTTEVQSTAASKAKREASNADATGPAKKRSKKLKATGISTKMKDISGMVAKWQKVQRDLSN